MFLIKLGQNISSCTLRKKQIDFFAALPECFIKFSQRRAGIAKDENREYLVFQII